MIEKLLHSRSQNYFCTLVTRKKYQNSFRKYSYKHFKKYCKKNDIGIFVASNDLIPKKSVYWKNSSWQKLLAPKILKKKYKKIKNICMIDSDVLINTESPNIFKFHKKNQISVVSLRKFMPYEWENTTRRMAFLRNKFYSKKYPLDSALNISLKNLYKFHKLEPQRHHFCAGIYVISASSFNKLYDFFFNYKRNVNSITGGGEQTHFNYFAQKNFKINILDYRFQAQWVFEMSNYYPFLYNKELSKNSNLISGCIEASLSNNYFLHFAGSWHEGVMWKKNLKNILGNEFSKRFNIYRKMKLKGKPIGLVKP